VNGVVGTTYRTDLDPGTYRWNVRAHTLAGTSAASETWSFSFAQSAVDEEPKGNSGWDLTVSPNSISGSEQADITVAVPTGEEARARISLIDMEGREVQLVHDGVFPATGSSFPLRGEEIPSGTYFVLLRGETRNGGTTISRRVVIRF